MTNLPFYKYFLRYANRERLINALYRRCKSDIILMNTYDRDEVYSLCKIAFDKLEELCIDAGGPADESRGILVTYRNNDFDEVIKEFKGERYDMMMLPWQEWMNYPVDDFQDTGNFCEAAFLTMTFLGFTPDDCKKRVEEIEGKLLEAENDLKEGKFMSSEVFDKQIDEILSELMKNEQKP